MLTFYELADGQWVLFKDLPTDNNKTTNSIYFENIPLVNIREGKDTNSLIYFKKDMTGSPMTAINISGGGLKRRFI